MFGYFLRWPTDKWKAQVYDLVECMDSLTEEELDMLGIKALEHYYDEFKDKLPANIRNGTLEVPSFATIMSRPTQDLDTELAQEMNDLTIQQREKALHDIHGVNTIKENPVIVKKAIKELDTYLYSKLKSRQASAYNLALSIDKSYVESDKLRLRP